MLPKLLGKVEAVLFDLDETLLDAQMGLTWTHERLAELVSKFLVEKGVEVDHKTLVFRIRVLDDRMNRERQYNRNLWWPALAFGIKQGLVFPEDFIYRLTTQYWNTYSEYSSPYSDTIPTLNYLRRRGYKLGLVTDTDGAPGLKANRIDRLPFRRFFSVVVIAGEDTAELKPSPVPFLKASTMLNVSSRATVFVGDKPFTDIEGAKKADMKTILVWRRKWDSETKPDLTIKALKDLLAIL